MLRLCDVPTGGYSIPLLISERSFMRSVFDAAIQSSVLENQMV